MRLFAAVSIAAALAAGPAPAQDVAHHALAQEVASAERAFDAYTAEHGFTAGFVEFAAPEGLLFRPDPVNARAYLQGRPVSTDRALRWGPYRVGVAVSGDLAWDTGPWTYGDDQAHGWFFTIWERQPDGSWRWALDHGSGSTPTHVPVPPPGEEIIDPPGRAAPGPGEPVSQMDAAWAQVMEMDANHNSLLEMGFDAYPAILAEDAWVNTLDQGPAMTPEAVLRAVAARPAITGFEAIGGRASEAGDLAYTYGHARWASGRGHYIRVWRRVSGASDGWRIVYDQLSEAAS